MHSLLLAAALIGFGVYSLINPRQLYMSHPSYVWPPVIGPDPPTERLTERAVRIYASISVVVGIALGCLAFYRRSR
jgi:hypothetical protein